MAVSLPLPKPRQLTFAELEQFYPINCTIDPKTGEVKVNTQWYKQKLKTLVIAGKSVLVHAEALPRFQRWLKLIEEHGYNDRIVTVDGGFVPRIKRGKNVPKTTQGLSRHARGLAIDINALMNMRGSRGAQLGQAGCVRELVPLAYECGLVWGGDWFGELVDPMHFEVGVQR